MEPSLGNISAESCACSMLRVECLDNEEQGCLRVRNELYAVGRWTPHVGVVGPLSESRWSRSCS
jgi:hypothetical protein